MKADNFNSEDRKNRHRKNFDIKSQDKKPYEDEENLGAKKMSKEFKRKKQELDEDDWENWDRLYNH